LIILKFLYSYFLWDASPVKNVSAKALYEILHASQELRGQYQVLDVREKEEFDEYSINNLGVIHWPLSEKNSWRFKTPSLDRTIPTICLCARGRRSIFAAKYLGKTKSLCLTFICNVMMLSIFHHF
jgi:rhodanese-related sulfurtransferase